MNHVINRIIDWIKSNGKLSGDGKSFVLTTKDGPDVEFVAGWQKCDDHELLHVGRYCTVSGEVCREIVLQIRDGEFTYLVPPDWDCVNLLMEYFLHHMANRPAQVV